ncbi:Inositol polyphosphate multikinase, partial [Globisporangium splendens]
MVDEDSAFAVENVDSFTEMAHQVGGHATTKTSLKSFGGKILKPFQSKQRGEREHAFYERIFRTHSDNPAYKQLQPLLPGYHGMAIVNSTTQEAHSGDDAAVNSDNLDGKHLVMEDLTFGRNWPCIMDVKVGTRSYENDASTEKIAYEKQKFPLQESVGFRIQGIKAFDPKSRQYVQFDKHFGRNVGSKDDLVAAFGNYFATYSSAKVNILLLQAFIRRLEELKAWFDEQQELEFIASSLLFLYNGELSANADDEEDVLAKALAADIRLIDFAHVTHRPLDAPQRDEGVLTGIKTLTQCFQALLTQLQQQLQRE